MCVVDGALSVLRSEPAAATISYGGLEDEDGAPMSKRAKKKAKLLQRQLEDEQQEGGSDFDLGDGQVWQPYSPGMSSYVGRIMCSCGDSVLTKSRCCCS